MGPLGGTNKATWCVRLLPTTVSAYLAVSVPYWGHTAAVCLLVDGITRLRLPTRPHRPPLPPPAHPPPINSIRDITAVGKKLSQNPAVSARW